ncbi:hypothetical protein VTL71DRAFT_10941 [Oculimacula yallundae]|uniref:Uncharacterized protein n=1 Tax=Oculimacula yallundae TaxID=86028 RepID=A0ABR4CUT9_9HELO
MPLNSYIPEYGIVFGNPVIRDETQTPARHEELEPSSYGLLVAQEEAQKLRAEIKAQFHADEERAFLKSMTAAYKKTARREARMDLEEENRKELVRLKMKLRAEMVEMASGEVRELREEVRMKDLKIKALEDRADEVEDEVEEKIEKVKELEAVIAGMMKQVNGLKKKKVEHSGDTTDEEI